MSNLNNGVEDITNYLRLAENCLRGRRIAPYEAQYIQIKINEISMTLRSSIEPTSIDFTEDNSNV